MQLGYCISNRLRKPVIINTCRMLSVMFFTMTFPPLAVAALRNERKRRRPELDI